MRNLPEKNRYKIGEVAQAFGENTSMIRHWEKQFEMIKPQRNSRGHRFFTQKDVVCLKTIYHLTKEKGMTLDGAKQVLKTQGKKLTEKQELVMRLEYVKKTLSDIKDSL